MYHLLVIYESHPIKCNELVMGSGNVRHYTTLIKTLFVLECFQFIH